MVKILKRSMEVAVGIYVDHKKNELEKTNVKSLPKEKNVEKNQKRCHVLVSHDGTSQGQ